MRVVERKGLRQSVCTLYTRTQAVTGIRCLRCQQPPALPVLLPLLGGFVLLECTDRASDDSGRLLLCTKLVFDHSHTRERILHDLQDTYFIHRYTTHTHPVIPIHLCTIGIHVLLVKIQCAMIHDL